jgi:site-specific recombinase XerC
VSALVDASAAQILRPGAGHPRHEILAGAWLAGFRSERTRSAYGANIRRFFAWCEESGTDPLKVVRAHVDLWARQGEAAGLADRTVALRITTLASFYRYLVDEEVIAKDPTRGVRRPKIPHRSPTAWLKRSQLADFVEASAGLGVTPHALVCLLVFNGLRISEACGIDVDDRTTQGFYPLLEVIRKGGARQQIPLARPTEAAVDAAIDGRTTGPLLVNQAGNRITQRNAQLIIDKCIPAVRGDHGRITPHALRHSWATLALQTGALPDQVAHDGGWTGLAMVSYYGRHGVEDPARAVTHGVAGVVLSS